MMIMDEIVYTEYFPSIDIFTQNTTYRCHVVSELSKSCRTITDRDVKQKSPDFEAF